LAREIFGAKSLTNLIYRYLEARGVEPLLLSAYLSEAAKTESFRTSCGYFPPEALHHELDELLQFDLA
jgi:hypothetical protein